MHNISYTQNIQGESKERFTYLNQLAEKQSAAIARIEDKHVLDEHEMREGHETSNIVTARGSTPRRTRNDELWLRGRVRSNLLI